jgi:hypothetical protein
LEPDEIEARNMTLLAEIEYEDSKLEVEECVLDLESFIVERQRTEEGIESIRKEHPQEARRLEGESERAQETF